LSVKLTANAAVCCACDFKRTGWVRVEGLNVDRSHINGNKRLPAVSHDLELLLGVGELSPTARAYVAAFRTFTLLVWVAHDVLLLARCKLLFQILYLLLEVGKSRIRLVPDLRD
jgi:hypothetical protein